MGNFGIVRATKKPSEPETVKDKPTPKPDYIDQMFMDAQKQNAPEKETFFPFEKDHPVTKKIKQD